jgi:hypothetical protein
MVVTANAIGFFSEGTYAPCCQSTKKLPWAQEEANKGAKNMRLVGLLSRKEVSGRQNRMEEI